MIRPDGIVMPQTTGPCAFCDYLSGARPYTVVGTTDLVAVLVTREQRGVSHLLVLPVNHRETLVDATDDEARALMAALRDSANAISAVYRPEGTAVWQNNGAPAHQAIPHLHFHVAGTLSGGGTNWDAVPELPVSATDEIARQLRPQLRPDRWK